MYVEAIGKKCGCPRRTARAAAASHAASAYAQDEFRQLVNQLPRSANAVVLLNMEKAKQSPMGVREGWTAKIEKAFEAGLVRAPPQATRFVLAADIDFEFMEPVWEAAVMDSDIRRKMTKKYQIEF